jgi:hypothetical protein
MSFSSLVVAGWWFAKTKSNNASLAVGFANDRRPTTNDNL